MPDALPDATIARPLTFAFPLPGRRWALRHGTALVLNGFLRGVEIPGLGTRTGPGETGGLTAVFFVASGVRGRRGERTGAVTRWEVEGGKVVRTNEAAANAELVG